LSFGIGLDAWRALKFVDWVGPSIVARNQPKTKSSLRRVKTEAEFAVPWWSTILIHGLERFVAVGNQDDLFHTVIDDEQITDLLIVDLKWLVSSSRGSGYACLLVICA